MMRVKNDEKTIATINEYPNDKVQQYRWWFEENNNVFLFFLSFLCGDNSQKKCYDIRPYAGYFSFFSKSHAFPDSRFLPLKKLPHSMHQLSSMKFEIR